MNAFSPAEVLSRSLPPALADHPENLSRPLPEETVAKLEAAFADVFARSKAASLSVAVFLPDQGLWQAVRSRADQPALAPDARFHAGSIGKLFTAVAVLQLVDEGKFGLATTLDRWFPKIPGARRITIDQLLSHTSGLDDPAAQRDAGPDRVSRSPADWVRSVEGGRSIFAPGKKWSYLNAGYVLLGLIVEQERGLPLAQVFQSRLFEPLGLAQSQPITAPISPRCSSRVSMPDGAASTRLITRRHTGRASWRRRRAISSRSIKRC